MTTSPTRSPYPVQMMQVSPAGREFPLASELVELEATFFTTGIFEDRGEKGQVILTILGSEKDSNETRAFTCFFDYMTAVSMPGKIVRAAQAITLPRR